MANFDKALEWTLPHEGGYSNHKADKGGATNWGITQATLNRFNREHPELGFPDSVERINKDHSATIYKLGYWKYDRVDSQKIATKLFDMGVNMGPGTAVRLAQRALNALGMSLVEDGGFGPQTLLEINAADPDALMGELVRESTKYYHAIVDRDPTQAVFLRGWLNRATEVPHD